MTFLAIVYLLYLSASVLITVLVGYVLHRHGRPFLIDVFWGNTRTADAVNHLLLVGFYLTNIAFVLFQLYSRIDVEGWQSSVELLSAKLGLATTLLGIMHFFNVFVLLQVRQFVRSIQAS